MREFLETIVTILIIITTLSVGVWILGKFNDLIVSFGVPENVVFFIAGFAVGCFKKSFATWMLDYGDKVHRFVVERSRWS